jgi:hypothetical protein
MLKKLSKKSVLLFSAVMMLAAFVMPSMASAVAWSPVGSEHTLDSSTLQFSVAAVAGGSSCGVSQFTVDVRSSSTLTITNATFTNCTGTGTNGSGCSSTAKATKLPWTATATSTSTVQINGVHVDVNFAGSCALAGAPVTLTGNLGSGVFDTLAHQVTFNGAGGLSAHGPTGSNAATVTGTIRDTQQSLDLA